MHPSDDLLLTFASGGADLPHRVILEGHLASCSECRATVAALAAPGGSVVRALPPEPLPTGLWERLRARVEAPAPASPLDALPLPPAARAELPEIADLAWRSTWAPGARFTVLLRDKGTGSLLLVGHMPPGRTFPRHLHPGTEDVLVLTGGYEDHLGRYEAGEYAVYTPGSEHRPATEPDEECWILTRLELPIRFLGWRGLAQRLLGLG